MNFPDNVEEKPDGSIRYLNPSFNYAILFLWLVVLPGLNTRIHMTLSQTPINIPSLKQACITRLEELILSGALSIGERLPSERDFATQLGVSRPILHEALVDLHTKGLVEIQPRKGVFVMDYRRSGSLAILESLLSFHNNSLDPAFMQSLIDMRLLVETECARMASLNRTEKQLDGLEQILEQEKVQPRNQLGTLIDLDFSFHLSIAIASGNLVYPLIINSFKGVYTNLTGKFFQGYFQSSIVDQVYMYHTHLVEAIRKKEAETAIKVMIDMLRHGESFLKGLIP